MIGALAENLTVPLGRHVGAGLGACLDAGAVGVKINRAELDTLTGSTSDSVDETVHAARSLLSHRGGRRHGRRTSHGLHEAGGTLVAHPVPST